MAKGPAGRGRAGRRGGRWPGGDRPASARAGGPRPGGGELNGLAEYAKARIAETEASAPHPIALERSIEAGGQVVGVVLLLESGSENGEVPVLVDCDEVLAPRRRRWPRWRSSTPATTLSERCEGA